jgi:hypothetical protein
MAAGDDYFGTRFKQKKLKLNDMKKYNRGEQLEVDQSVGEGAYVRSSCHCQVAPSTRSVWTLHRPRMAMDRGQLG